MPQGGFLDAPRRSPATLAAVIALHAGVAALALFLPGGPIATLRIFPPTLVQQIPDAPTPPPLEREKPKPEEHATSRPTEPQVDVVTPILPPLDSAGPTFPKTLPQPRTDPEPQIVPPPAHTPVLTDAAVDPRYAGVFQPTYPARLMREEVTGKVVVRVLVGADGRVKALEPVSATDPLFLEATRRQALTRWRFVPATRDGAPIEAWRTMTVRFEMNG